MRYIAFWSPWSRLAKANPDTKLTILEKWPKAGYCHRLVSISWRCSPVPRPRGTACPQIRHHYGKGPLIIGECYNLPCLANTHFHLKQLRLKVLQWWSISFKVLTFHPLQGMIHQSMFMATYIHNKFKTNQEYAFCMSSKNTFQSSNKQYNLNYHQS